MRILKSLGGSARLGEIYDAVQALGLDRDRPHWQAKVRQTLGLCARRTSPGQFTLSL